MTNHMMRTFSFTRKATGRFLVFMALITITNALSATWVRQRGEALLGLGASYTSANKVYDDAGKTQAYPRFTETALNLYGEYGVTDKLTVGAFLPLQNLQIAEDAALLSNQRSYTGIGDSVASARYQFVSGPLLVSAALDLGLPTGNTNATIPSGDGEFSVLPRVSAAGSFQLGMPAFYMLSTGYHKRTVGFSDEIQAQLMGGFRASFITFILSFELRQSLKNGDASAISASPLLYNNASYITYAPGLVFHASDRLSFNIFFKGGALVRNIIAAPSISAGVAYVF